MTGSRTRRGAVSQSAIERAIRALQKTGSEVSRVEIRTDGVVQIFTSKDPAAEELYNE